MHPGPWHSWLPGSGRNPVVVPACKFLSPFFAAVPLEAYAFCDKLAQFILKNLKGVNLMGKLLGNLKLTILSGVVLTVVIYYLAPVIAG